MTEIYQICVHSMNILIYFYPKHTLKLAKKKTLPNQSTIEFIHNSFHWRSLDAWRLDKGKEIITLITKLSSLFLFFTFKFQEVEVNIIGSFIKTLI